MRHLLYLMFRYDFDVMESLKTLEELNTAIEWNPLGQSFSLPAQCTRLNDSSLNSLHQQSICRTTPAAMPLAIADSDRALGTGKRHHGSMAAFARVLLPAGLGGLTRTQTILPIHQITGKGRVWLDFMEFFFVFDH